MLFSNVEDFETFLIASDFTDAVEIPPHVGLHFDRGAELPASLRTEIAQHGWEVAGANGYPTVISLGEGGDVRQPTRDEVTTMEAVALALPGFLGVDSPNDRRALRRAWEGGDSIGRTLTVATHAGDIEISLAAPPSFESQGIGESMDLLADLEALGFDENRDLVDDDAKGFGLRPSVRRRRRSSCARSSWISLATTSAS